MAFSFSKKSILIVAFLACCAFAQMFRGDNSRSGQANAVITPPFEIVHTTTINAIIVSSPIIVNDTLFIGARDSSVYAFYNGTQVWKFKTKGWVDASPVYYNGKIYAGSRDGYLYILNAATGDSLGGIANNNAQCSTPLIYDSLIVFGRGGWCKNINAYNVSNGRYVWHYSNDQMVYSSPALVDSILCYGENGGNIVALNAHTGTFMWKYMTEGGVYLSSPAISNGILYFSPGSYDKYVYALSLRTGSLIWKNASSIESFAPQADDYLVRKLLPFKPATRKKMLDAYKKRLELRSYKLRVYEPLTKDRADARDFVPVGGNATSSVTVGNSNVFVIHKEYGYPKPRFSITAFDKNTSTEQWCFSEMRNCEQLGFCSSPLVADSVVFFGWGEGKVYAFHATNGTKLWEDSVSGDILSSPAAANGRVYVATATGNIVTFLEAEQEPLNFKDETYCYPNPARGNVSHIRIGVPKNGTVTMIIYNMNEKPVLRIKKKLRVNEVWPYDWNIENVANGVYFALIKVEYDGGGDDEEILKIAVLH